MTKPQTTDATQTESLLTDILLRIYVAGAVSFFAVAAFIQWQAAPTRITLLLLALTEIITVAIIVCSRRAQRRDWRPLSVATSFISMFFFLALNLEPAKHIVPEAIGIGLQITGLLLLQLYAKLSLGRSFGVLPAFRRLVTSGAYQWVRHPIYFAYFVSHVGFLLANFSLQNLLVFAVLYTAQIIRIHREEQMLIGFPGYLDYSKRVRYRLIPGIY